MTDVDAGSRDRLALAVLSQYWMATAEQMHRILSPDVRIEQTRRRLVKLRGEGLSDRVTLPQAGRPRVWYATATRHRWRPAGPSCAATGPAGRERPDRGAAGRRTRTDRHGDRAGVPAVRPPLRGDAAGRQRHPPLRRPHRPARSAVMAICASHSTGPPRSTTPRRGEAVILDTLLYYRSSDTTDDGEGGVVLRAFVEVGRASIGPERLAAKLGAYARLLQCPHPHPGHGSNWSCGRSAGGSGTRCSRGYCSPWTPQAPPAFTPA
ncbi:replication-relaxation family protein [Streptomyces sp. NPDC047725]|uniref:replication-relaxation family protein n=1 Tax=Streptomyces sp. NPDC047725 TaxID=3365487 RepID=UPI00370FE8E6